ncbi:MAG: putative ABC transporter permease [bacterium]
MYTWTQLVFFFYVYAFLGWAVEVGVYSVTRRRFLNRGMLSLPLMLNYGFVFALMAAVLPSFGENRVAAFFQTLMLYAVVERLAAFFVLHAAPGVAWDTDRRNILGGTLKGVWASLAIALAYYLFYLIFHPLLVTVSLFVPRVLMLAVNWVLTVATLVDLVASSLAVRRRGERGFEERQAGSRQTRLAERLENRIWGRLQKAYPGVREMSGAEADALYTFGKGMSFDKIIWIFFLCALLGDIIETFYCGLVDHAWMNRSSVLYGPFSFVWGIGGVVLTITLQPLSKKRDFVIFAAGFFIGGAYEYLCSVFTELVFGTVFWDYSDMPLNIGGRTNVLFCFFWGVLALGWIKFAFPHLSGLIEKIPPLAGKVVTWVLCVAMVLNAGLTAFAMLRYNVRRALVEEHGEAVAFTVLDTLIDSHYPDSFIENRWPNMIVTDGKENGYE